MPVESDFESNLGTGFEERFARELRVAATLAPDERLFALAAGAERLGRRRRNRRRAAVAGGAAIAVLAVGSVGAFTGGPGLGMFGPAVEPPMTGDEVVRLVAGLLPPGAVTDATASTPGNAGPSSDPHLALGLFNFDDGKGVSSIHYFVERGTQRPEWAAVCIDPAVRPKDSCDRTVRPDGSVLVIDKARDATFTGQREWRGIYARPDGTVIRLVEFNGNQANPTRELPPLDAAQLAAVVTAPEWGRVVAEIPANPNAPEVSGPAQSSSTAATPTAPPSTPTASTAPPSPVTVPPSPGIASPAPGDSLPELAAVLAGLLPTGAKEVGRDAENGAVTVEYEGRTSRLTIHVEPAGARGIEFKKGAEESTPTPLEVRQKLPDGTLVVMNQFGNGKSAVDPLLHWVAWVYYPDGRNILISEGNGEDELSPRPGQPALSVEQLRAMVMAPDWRR
ncbi:hypothetical protein [Kitasatospora purpeofusca]|uniref:hypothetical protein n=1 Tax=Kitasatospora purpeofusca TaxID=67352 RepID=UPI0004BE64B4|nr:hypothetical protein [Kitasatospora purpeofusca]